MTPSAAQTRHSFANSALLPGRFAFGSLKTAMHGGAYGTQPIPIAKARLRIVVKTLGAFSSIAGFGRAVPRVIKQLLTDQLGRREDSFAWREHQTALDPAAYRSMLVLHTDAKLGDAIINSLLIDGLARACPHLSITVGTSAGFADYWSSHPDVKSVLVLPDRLGQGAIKRFLATRRAATPHIGAFDLLVCYDQFASFDTFALIRRLAPKKVIGFNKHAYRLFDHSLEEHRYGTQVRHISSRVSSVLGALGLQIELEQLNLHLPTTSAALTEARSVIAGGGSGPRLLINTYGAGPEKRLTPAVVREMLPDLPAGTVYLSVPAGSEAAYRMDDDRVVVVSQLSNFQALFSLVSLMDWVVSPDSAVAHVAAAYGRPQVTIFAVKNPTVWLPMNCRGEAVVSAEGDVSRFDWGDFRNAVARVRP